MNQSARPSENLQRQLLKAVPAEVALPRISQEYVIGVLFTASAVLLLPLVYLAVMAFLLGSLTALVWRADLIFAGWPLVVKWGVVLTLVFSGGSCLLGLIKPFFASSVITNRPQILRRSSEPFLFEYVDRLCHAIGAPPPSEIHLTVDLNAAAEFRNGWRSIVNDREVSLYIGLPLVAGLTLRQFTGVLTHELGHFTQRTAMWLENIVRRTNFWFLRAAYEQDSIDVWLQKQVTNGGLLGSASSFSAKVVWVTRRILLALANAGTAIGCLMSRQLEFNADHCQIRMVGSQTLASTLRRTRELQLAHQSSYRDVAIFLDEGRLPNDFTELVIANTAFITPNIKKKIQRMMMDEKTGMLDSHPTDRDRILAAIADQSPGLLQHGSSADHLPASILFQRFEDVSKALTTKYFENSFKQKIDPRILFPVEKLLERQNVQIHAAKALCRYFQTEIPRHRPLIIAPQANEAPEDPRQIVNELKSCRERMIQELPEYRRLIPRYRMAEEVLIENITAQALLQAKFPVQSEEFPRTHLDGLAEQQTRAREGLATLAGKLLPFETEAGNRLSFALQLIHVPAVTRKIDKGEDLFFELKELVPAAQYISRLIGELPLLKMITAPLASIKERLKKTHSHDSPDDSLGNQMKLLCSQLSGIVVDMGDRLYPLDHAQAETKLCEYVMPHRPSDHKLREIVDAAEFAQSRLITLQLRLFANLAQSAEKIEQVLGLPLLPEPQREPDE